MHEIKCPRCGEIFQVDESGYAAIVKQVRDQEFAKEVRDCQERYQKEKDDAIALALAKEQTLHQSEISVMQQRLTSLELEKSRPKQSPPCKFHVQSRSKSIYLHKKKQKMLYYGKK